jgi:hypothetical protein
MQLFPMIMSIISSGNVSNFDQSELGSLAFPLKQQRNREHCGVLFRQTLPQYLIIKSLRTKITIINMSKIIIKYLLARKILTQTCSILVHVLDL